MKTLWSADQQPEAMPSVLFCSGDSSTTGPPLINPKVGLLVFWTSVMSATAMSATVIEGLHYTTHTHHTGVERSWASQRNWTSQRNWIPLTMSLL